MSDRGKGGSKGIEKKHPVMLEENQHMVSGSHVKNVNQRGMPHQLCSVLLINSDEEKDMTTRLNNVAVKHDLDESKFSGMAQVNPQLQCAQERMGEEKLKTTQGTISRE